jgi:hypothetical protein
MNKPNSTKKRLLLGNTKSTSCDDTNKKRKYKTTLCQKGMRTIICHGVGNHIIEYAIVGYLIH